MMGIARIDLAVLPDTQKATIGEQPDAGTARFCNDKKSIKKGDECPVFDPLKREDHMRHGKQRRGALFSARKQSIFLTTGQAPGACLFLWVLFFEIKEKNILRPVAKQSAKRRHL